MEWGKVMINDDFDAIFERSMYHMAMDLDGTNIKLPSHCEDIEQIIKNVISKKYN